MFYRVIILLGALMLGKNLQAQELYVFSDPASNIPARSITTKLGMRLADPELAGGLKQRYQAEVMAGLNKHLMVRVSTTFSDVYSQHLQWESAKAYIKWRFYSNDAIHRHLRLAAFADGAYAGHSMNYGEMNLDGDNSGIQAGIIATQLVHKLALSGSASLMHVFDEKFKSSLYRGMQDQNALAYNFSMGYLLLPRTYSGYNQVNLNIYLEVLGMKGLEKGGYYLDLGPAIQFIFASTTKLNLGARFETGTNMERLGGNSYYLSVETSFLNVLRSRSR